MFDSIAPTGGPMSALIEPDRVHRRIYTDPAIFEQEINKVFGAVWVYLAHESEIPEPNDFRTTTMGLRPVIVTRTENGDVEALFNRCTHRAATLCVEASGNAKRFTCPYHGWNFRNDGELAGVPFRAGYGDQFDPSRFALGKVLRVDSYRGFIFGTLNPDVCSLSDYLGPVKDIMDGFIDRSPTGELIVRSGAYRGVAHGNWKLVWDNAADGYHPLFSHRSLMEMTKQRYGSGTGVTYYAQDPDTGPMYCQDLGNGHTFLHQRPAMGPSLWDRARPTPGSEASVSVLEGTMGSEQSRAWLETAPGAGINLNIFPNLMLIGNQLQVIEPLAVDRTRLTWYATTLGGVPEEVNTLRMRIAEDFPNFGETDDMAIFQRVQEGLAVPELEWVDCSRGLHRDPFEGLDERGVRTVPATDETPMRAYLRTWASVMDQEVKLDHR